MLASLLGLAEEQPTDLHSAARQGNLAAVEALLAQGADPNQEDSVGDPPLHVAAAWQQGHSGAALAAALLRAPGVMVDARDSRGRTPLHVALQVLNLEVALALRAARADLVEDPITHRSPLHLAAALQDLGAVEQILQHGADVDVVDSEGTTPLLVAASLGQEAAALALIAAGADPTRGNNLGVTPLHCACRVGHSVELVTALLGAGAEPNAMTMYGDTPLHVMTLGQGREAAVVQAMLQHGARVDAVNTMGRTALFQAVRQGAAGVMEALLEAGADPSAADRLGCTPMHDAARSGSEEAVQLLLAWGAASDPQDNMGRTPMHEAPAPAVIALLAAAGADVNEQDDLGKMPLHAAVARSKPAAVRCLAGLGAQLEAAALGCLTPLAFACRVSDTETIAALLDCGADVAVLDECGLPPLARTRPGLLRGSGMAVMLRLVPDGGLPEHVVAACVGRLGERDRAALQQVLLAANRQLPQRQLTEALLRRIALMLCMLCLSYEEAEGWAWRQRTA